jgi:hypothetical protein
MPPVRVIVAGPEDGSAELWLGGELMAETVRYDGRLHVRILPRSGGEPWLLEMSGLALALDDAARRIGGL